MGPMDVTRHGLAAKCLHSPRLATPMDDHGCLSLFGDRPDQHRLLADHLTAEYRVKTQGRGRTVDEWKQRPERTDSWTVYGRTPLCTGHIEHLTSEQNLQNAT